MAHGKNNFSSFAIFPLCDRGFATLSYHAQPAGYRPIRNERASEWIQRRIGTGLSTAKISMCGKGGAFFEKHLKIIIMGLKPAENGEPEDPFPWQGCGKFERRDWQRASYRQTEIAHASAADGDARASTQRAWQPTEMQFGSSPLTFRTHPLPYRRLLRILKAWNCLRAMRLSVCRRPSVWR